MQHSLNRRHRLLLFNNREEEGKKNPYIIVLPDDIEATNSDLPLLLLYCSHSPHYKLAHRAAVCPTSTYIPSYGIV